MSQHGGEVDSASELTLSNPTTDPQFGSMLIYYTLDGSDPRLPGGEVSPAAELADASALTFDAGKTTLRARTYAAPSNRWSPCTEAHFRLARQ